MLTFFERVLSWLLRAWLRAWFVMFFRTFLIADFVLAIAGEKRPTLPTPTGSQGFCPPDPPRPHGNPSGLAPRSVDSGTKAKAPAKIHQASFISPNCGSPLDVFG